MANQQSIQRICVISILLVALLARFHYLTKIEHNVDHAYPVWQALQTLDRGTFPLVGQGTSVLFNNPPLTGYLFLPIMALTRSPLGIYIFVILLNTLAVWMAYRAIKSLLGFIPGLVAAGLMAVNPWVIEYSRTSWVQSLLPFFVCAVAWLLWPVLTGRTSRPQRRLLLALVMTTLMTQTYLLAFFIVLPVGMLLLIFRQRVPVRALAVGIAVFALATGAFAAALLHEDLDSRLETFTEGQARLSLESWEHAIRLVNGAEYELARGLNAPADDAPLRHRLSQPLHLALQLLVLTGLAAAIHAVATGSDRRDTGIILLLWFGLPVIAMLYTTNLIHPTYQLLGLPAGFGLAAWGSDLLLRRHWMRPVFLAAAIPFAVLMLTNSARYYQETAAHPGTHELGALPVGDGLRLGAVLRDILPADGVVYADTDAWTLQSFAGRMFFFARDARAPDLTIIPAQGGAYVRLGEDAAPYGSVPAATIHLADGTDIHVDRFAPAAEIDLPDNRLDIPTEQAITLLAYDLQQESGSYQLTLAWRVEAYNMEVLNRIYGPAVHVFDADGEQVLNLGGAGLQGHNWHPGDVHIHQIAFAFPPDAAGPFTLKVGQYDGVHQASLVFLLPEPDIFVTLPEIIEQK